VRSWAIDSDDPTVTGGATRRAADTYRKFPQNLWMRVQASSSSALEVA
jgi:hypothetical protein